ncbi:MAG: thiolase, partial [Actinomycetota bacterium]|nr:thiolase [Actinomycetota bacterium]
MGKREAVIVGVADAPLEEGVISGGATPLGVQARTARAALNEAGLTFDDVDGLLTAGMWGMPGPGQHPTVTFGEYLGIQPRFVDGTNIGGSSFEAHVAHAALAIERGYCEVALITYGSTQKSDRSRTLAGRAPALTTQFETPWGLLTPVGGYALAATRHMYEHGTTSEQLAEIAVATRKWAALNPDATMRAPISVDDVLSSRMISDPLHLLDCCLVTDGGGALVMTNQEHARSLRKPPVFVRGYGEAHTHWTIAAM